MLRFHWMLPKGGEVDLDSPREAARHRVAATGAGSPAADPDMEGWTRFGRQAEAAGIDSLLIALSLAEPDPVMIACALGRETSTLGSIIAFRAGLKQPTTMVHQINTLSVLVDGRVSLNLVAGSSSREQHAYGDFLPHDERYERAGEFIAICRGLWADAGGAGVDFTGRHYRVEKARLNTPFVGNGRSHPEIYVSGHSAASERLVREQGTCWLRVIDTPEALAEPVAAMRAAGREVCLRACLLARPTRDEALEDLEHLASGGDLGVAMPVREDSQMHREAASPAAGELWRSPTIWTGLASLRGPVWTTLVGSYDEVASTLVDLGQIGVTQFILSGWPEAAELDRFGAEVEPRVRAAERRAGAG